MHLLDTILIVDDSIMNRKLLSDILVKDYYIICAENGMEAFKVLAKSRLKISAIVLDLIMPVMDGFEFMQEIANYDEYKNIPIIITTAQNDKDSELKALKCGAWDFVTKPYQPEILKFRLKNAIERSELSAFNKLKYIAEFDELTNIYNKSKFIAEATDIIKSDKFENLALFRFDIDKFSLINTFFGYKEGDEILKYCAGLIDKICKNRDISTYGRIRADVFAFCISIKSLLEIEEITQKINTELNKYDINFTLVPSVSVYLIKDKDISVNLMLDYAELAAKTIKGNYIKMYAVYESWMIQETAEKQSIINEMDKSLSNDEFVVYYQPKYDTKTFKVCGSEALVRWFHPTKGMISPEIFIPVFEECGFITKMDYYIWEKVCCDIRKWIDEGITVKPVSINISRVDLFANDLLDTLCEITKKYDIPHEILQLEITESVYVYNNDFLKKIVAKLHEKGFVILMDDFGSGFSSLNILKEIDIDVLKIDMKFFQKAGDEGKGRTIITSVICMANGLNISTVAEGVETEDQVAFLKGIGCDIIQGYFFSKPLPSEEYRALIRENKTFKNTNIDITMIDNSVLSGSQLQVLFSTLPQPMALYYVGEETIKALYVNAAYTSLFGHSSESSVITPPKQKVDGKNSYNFKKCFTDVILDKTARDYEYIALVDNKEINIKMRIIYLCKLGNSHIVLVGFYNSSDKKQITGKLKLKSGKLSSFKKHNFVNTMLVVDDMRTNRMIIKDIFKDSYHILEAENGQQALDILNEQGEDIDIILLDLIMPVMDGFTFLKHKMKNGNYYDIPVIIITSSDSPEQQLQTMELGANDYISKPFMPDVVQRRVNNFVKSRKKFKKVLKEYNNLVKKAQYDLLTRIYNRSTAQDMIISALSINSGQKNAFIMMDVDKFKLINDTYGHNIGDVVLRTVADTLKETFRKSDVVSRFGGDEFCVLMQNIGAEEDVVKKCTEFIDKLSAKSISSFDIHTNVSIGYCIDDRSMTFEEVYQHADKALYDSKHKGTGLITGYKLD